MNRRALPRDAIAERRTPTFTADTVPAGLLEAHETAVWARLEVDFGSVEFIEEGTGWRTTADPEHPVVIVPRRRHRVKPAADARFAVQFFSTERGISHR